MKIPALLLIVILICGLSYGCSTSTTTTTSPSSTQVLVIDIGSPAAKNWKGDQQTDGVEFYLTPKDLQNKMVQTPGTVSAQLWLAESFLQSEHKGDLVQQWSGIKITKSDYDTSTGARIRLEYGNFQPVELQYGILEVTLETPDAKKFTATATSVKLW
jgi:hypothetical protein